MTRSPLARATVTFADPGSTGIIIPLENDKAFNVFQVSLVVPCHSSHGTQALSRGHVIIIIANNLNLELENTLLVAVVSGYLNRGEAQAAFLLFQNPDNYGKKLEKNIK